MFLSSFLRVVFIILNKSHWNEKEKTRPYDQDDIFFLDGKKHFLFFISSHSCRLKSNLLLGYNKAFIALTLSRSKQNLNMTLCKKKFRTKDNIYRLRIHKIVSITLFKISCQFQQPNCQKLKVKTIEGRAISINE